MTLFCNCLPQPTVLRVWDLIFLEGNEILLRTALAIWQVLAGRILTVRTADEFYCLMGVLTRELLDFDFVDANSLIKAVVAIGSLTELTTLREHYLYNINPWGTSIPKVVDKQIKLYSKQSIALDIGALKKQYTKLKQRQRQAHIIFTAAITRQPSRSPPVTMNHLLLGKSALVPAKRLGPPPGSIPPPPKPPSTLHWKDAPKQSSSSSSSDTELCDDEIESHSEGEDEDKGQFVEDNRIQISESLMTEDNTTTSAKVSASLAVDNSSLMTDSITNIKSESDEENFDFEQFLVDRVKCLKELDDENVAEEKINFARRNSERALQIIQENSLILQRIMQCQSRLSPPNVETQEGDIEVLLDPTALDTEIPILSPDDIMSTTVTIHPQQPSVDYFNDTEFLGRNLNYITVDQVFPIPDNTTPLEESPVSPKLTQITPPLIELPIQQDVDNDALKLIKDTYRGLRPVVTSVKVEPTSPPSYFDQSYVASETSERTNEESPIFVYSNKIVPTFSEFFKTEITSPEESRLQMLSSEKISEGFSISHKPMKSAPTSPAQFQIELTPPIYNLNDQNLAESPIYGSKYTNILEKSKSLDERYNALILGKQPINILKSGTTDTFRIPDGCKAPPDFETNTLYNTNLDEKFNNSSNNFQGDIVNDLIPTSSLFSTDDSPKSENHVITLNRSFQLESNVELAQTADIIVSKTPSLFFDKVDQAEIIDKHDKFSKYKFTNTDYKDEEFREPDSRDKETFIYKFQDNIITGNTMMNTSEDLIHNEYDVFGNKIDNSHLTRQEVNCEEQFSPLANKEYKLPSPEFKKFYTISRGFSFKDDEAELNPLSPLSPTLSFKNKNLDLDSTTEHEPRTNTDYNCSDANMKIESPNYLDDIKRYSTIETPKVDALLSSNSQTCYSYLNQKGEKNDQAKNENWDVTEKKKYLNIDLTATKSTISPLISPLRPLKSPSRSPLKSPNKGFNPFPVASSTRQNKEVLLKLGLYKK